MTGWNMRVCKLALAMMLVPAFVQAQAMPEPATEGYGGIETVLETMKPVVEAIFVQQQRSLADGCDKIAIVRPGSISILEPLEVEGDDVKPVKGRWNARYIVDACSKIVLRNVAMQVTDNGVAVDPLVPGDSLADKELQADVERSFTMAGQVAMPECTEAVTMREAKVRVFPKTAKDKWQELWIGRMCGRDLGQVVSFEPNDNGTAFSMAVPKANDAAK